MRLRFAFVAAVAVAGAAPASAAHAGAGVPRVALSVSPARIALATPASRTVELRNVGAEPVAVELVRKSVDRSTAKQSLSIRPARLTLRSGSRALITLRVNAPRPARPGDHRLLVLAIARPIGRSRVAVRIRLGIGVRFRVPGRIHRRLELGGVQVRRQGSGRTIVVFVANRGNVTEKPRGPLIVTLVRGGSIVSHLRARVPRELYPGTRSAVRLPYVGRVRGAVTAVVKLRFEGGRRARTRRYRLRL